MKTTTKQVKEFMKEINNLKLSQQNYDALKEVLMRQAKLFVEAKNQIKELKLVADSAHSTAQWTLDANRRQMLHIKFLNQQIIDAKQSLEKMEQNPSFAKQHLEDLRIILDHPYIFKGEP
jgi:hypothetical protein